MRCPLTKVPPLLRSMRVKPVSLRTSLACWRETKGSEKTTSASAFRPTTISSLSSGQVCSSPVESTHFKYGIAMVRSFDRLPFGAAWAKRNCFNLSDSPAGVC